jgi:diphosphate-dependent phosphofructokinase
MLSRGEEPKRDAFGHVKLDTINVGSWFAKQFAGMVGAEKTMVQKSGYFSRSASANEQDLALIQACADLAAEAALRGESGVVGHDEEAGDVLRVCEFPRIKGGKAFDPSEPWFQELLDEIGQPQH